METIWYRNPEHDRLSAENGKHVILFANGRFCRLISIESRDSLVCVKTYPHVSMLDERTDDLIKINDHLFYWDTPYLNDSLCISDKYDAFLKLYQEYWERNNEADVETHRSYTYNNMREEVSGHSSTSCNNDTDLKFDITLGGMKVGSVRIHLGIVDDNEKKQVVKCNRIGIEKQIKVVLERADIDNNACDHQASQMADLILAQASRSLSSQGISFDPAAF